MGYPIGAQRSSWYKIGACNVNCLKTTLLIILKLTTIWLFLEHCQRSSVGRATDS